MSNVVAVVFAGGSGIRMGAEIPKQFIEIAGRPILAYTLQLFQEHEKVDGIYLVSNSDYLERSQKIVIENSFSKVKGIVPGGCTAQDSIYNGLISISEDYADDTIVLVHDGVRPHVHPNVIDRNIECVIANGNAVTCTPCVETLVVSGDGERVSDIPLRRMSYSAQAPQSFRLRDILAAHERIRKMPNGYTDLVDQATIFWRLDVPINLVPGNRGNIKITTQEDICVFEALLKLRR